MEGWGRAAARHSARTMDHECRYNSISSFFFFLPLALHVPPTFCVRPVQQFAASVGRRRSGCRDARQACSCEARSDFCFSVSQKAAIRVVIVSLLVKDPSRLAPPLQPTPVSTHWHIRTRTPSLPRVGTEWNSRISARSGVTPLSFVCQEGLLVLFCFFFPSQVSGARDCSIGRAGLRRAL